MRSMAGGRQHAVDGAGDDRARRPWSCSAWAAFTIVPAVSMMSSCRTQIAARDVADDVHHLGRAVFELRRLSMIASSAPRRLA